MPIEIDSASLWHFADEVMGGASQCLWRLRTRQIAVDQLADPGPKRLSEVGPQHIVSRYCQDGFCCSVKRRDPAGRINRDNTVSHAAEDAGLIPYEIGDFLEA